jgi:hypothetical protein
LQVVDCLGPRDVLCRITLLLTLKHDKNKAHQRRPLRGRGTEREGDQGDETITAGR